MTYIGDIKKLDGILTDLSRYSGFERLEAEIKSNDWEQFESAFAVAREAHHLHIKEIPLEFEPEVMVNGKRRKPDFKAQLINRWVYFEIKASSMFPFEKELLKIEDKVHKGLKSITPDLKFVIKIYQEKISEGDIAPLADSIEKNVLNLWETGANFPKKYLYPDKSNHIAEYIFLGDINSVVYADDAQSDSPFTPGEQFLWIKASIPKEGCKGTFALLKTRNGKKLMFMGSEEFDVRKYLQVLAEQLWETQVNLNEQYFGLFLLNLINVLSTKNYLMIGVSPLYKPKERVKNIVEKAIGQLPQDSANILVVYTREVILQMNEIEKAVQNILTSNKNNKISCVIADTQLATGEKRIKLFINPNGLIPLTKEEIGRLNSQ